MEYPAIKTKARVEMIETKANRFCMPGTISWRLAMVRNGWMTPVPVPQMALARIAPYRGYPI